MLTSKVKLFLQHDPQSWADPFVAMSEWVCRV